jgi:cation diffusion facilitator CzcD-associated flavoprotein CzcO
MSSVPGRPQIDPTALRAKYDEERARRLRADGIRQYVEPEGKFAHFTNDPYTQRVDRAPFEDNVEVLVIGGGWGGQLAAVKLIESGIEDIRIIEQAGDFGGAWYWNRYPGLQCDIDSYCYMPLLEETGYIPTLKYAMQPEILGHARRIGKHYDLYRRTCFHTKVKDVRWDEACQKWTVTTDRNDRIRARYVIQSIGPLDKPKLPGIPGIETFRGHSFHTSRWDYEYTGGDSTGNLSGLEDKRVAIIGTGATSVQCIPHLGRSAKMLYVFQRTPVAVRLRGNKPTSADWAKSLKPGWQRRRMENFGNIVAGTAPEDHDLVQDGWTDMFQKLGAVILTGRTGAGPGKLTADEMAEITELADFEYMNETRALVDKLVEDKATAESLKPWFRNFCKRPTFNDDYLPTFNRQNVKLIDTKGRGVERITEHGVVFDGVEYEVDCIIYATGFEYSGGQSLAHRGGFEIYGRDGGSLSEYWADGMKTYHGFLSRGFPNLFHTGVSQNGLTLNFPHNLLVQAEHIAAILKEVRLRQLTRVEPLLDAESAWVATIREKAFTNRGFLDACTPGTLNGEGRSDEAFGSQQYGGGSVEYWELLRSWRRQGELSGLTVV